MFVIQWLYNLKWSFSIYVFSTAAPCIVSLSTSGLIVHQGLRPCVPLPQRAYTTSSKTSIKLSKYAWCSSHLAEFICTFVEITWIGVFYTSLLTIYLNFKIFSTQVCGENPLSDVWLAYWKSHFNYCLHGFVNNTLSMLCVAILLSWVLFFLDKEIYKQFNDFSVSYLKIYLVDLRPCRLMVIGERFPHSIVVMLHQICCTHGGADFAEFPDCCGVSHRFIGSLGETNSNVAEGLCTAIQLFDDLSSLRKPT